MTTDVQPDGGQAALWNSGRGSGWVMLKGMLDDLFRPFEEVLVQPLAPGSHVLDIGCGTGSTTLAAAGRTGREGHCTGLDISGDMIAAARDSAVDQGNVDFICADAETHEFKPHRFDTLISRFGVMFFADPVAAFANLRHAAKPSARLRMITWRGPEENPFMTLAERKAAEMGIDCPPRKAGEPGQFGLAEPDPIRRILTGAGWAEITIEPLDIVCCLPESGLDLYLARMGVVGTMLPSLDEETQRQVLAAVREAFAPYIENGEVRFNAACWLIEAVAPKAGSE